MTLLLDPSRLPARRAAASGPLAPLARSLASDFHPLIGRDLLLPREKARLSRAGGRCPDDATLLEFDPFSPRLHRCPTCGRSYDDEAHYRWWIMGYQLWLGERAVHGALLRLLTGDARAGALSEQILDAYASIYLEYPNRDNVLGPSRLFFSTYLESIWLLQIVIATDLLEAGGRVSPLAARVRDRIIEPAVTLIREYDEGASNRQVWNNAALLAGGAALGATPELEPLVWGPSGLASHLARGLLGDGTWYEGENYHLFAHRGLWYGVQLAERLDLGLSENFIVPFIARFEEGFAASFVTALPDLTLPSRRDSQYAISIRQWRFAEICELGLSRRDDPRLVGMLGRLYGDDVPRRETGRATSTAEVERNLPPTSLTRADLGWRALLFARAELPALDPVPPDSVLLEGQGIAILRRNAGETYAALDYGHSGGGHGHPDRLNLLLVDGPVRWLDDMGAGSYVDPSLHWYRSTLAHNAPLIDGQSQVRTHGTLRAYDERAAEGWVEAEVAGIAPGVIVRRVISVMDGYLIDVMTWDADREVQVDLPFHLDAADVAGVEWTGGALEGGMGLEDGFGYLRDAAFVVLAGGVTRLHSVRSGRKLSAWITADEARELWRALAPGAPGHPDATFSLIRSRGRSGSVRSLLDWSGSVRDVRFTESGVVVDAIDGSTHTHSRRGRSWHVEVESTRPGASRTIELDGVVAAPVAPVATRSIASAPARRRRRLVVPEIDGDRGLLVLNLGETHYRRSELQWKSAGAPSASIRLGATATTLRVQVQVRKSAPSVFAPARGWNELDNENPDINSDGVQLHLAGADPASPAASWLLVPEPGRSTLRITASNGAPHIEAAWQVTEGGYTVSCDVPLTDDMRRDGFDLDVIVNEISPDRERRRGQLVLSGAHGEWVFLRGDRQSRERLVPFTLDNGAR